MRQNVKKIKRRIKRRIKNKYMVMSMGFYDIPAKSLFECNTYKKAEEWVNREIDRVEYNGFTRYRIERIDDF